MTLHYSYKALEKRILNKTGCLLEWVCLLFQLSSVSLRGWNYLLIARIYFQMKSSLCCIAQNCKAKIKKNEKADAHMFIWLTRRLFVSPFVCFHFVFDCSKELCHSFRNVSVRRRNLFSFFPNSPKKLCDFQIFYLERKQKSEWHTNHPGRVGPFDYLDRSVIYDREGKPIKIM